MQRIVTRFPIIKDFLNYEKTQMLEKFPDVIPTNVESHPSEISHMKYALDSSWAKKDDRVTSGLGKKS